MTHPTRHFGCAERRPVGGKGCYRQLPVGQLGIGLRLLNVRIARDPGGGSLRGFPHLNTGSGSALIKSGI